jgi:1-pyrroline-5-carboxylate dehydrogenase
MLFVHSHWAKAGIYDKLAALAQKRSLADLTCGPVMTWTTEAMLVRCLGEVGWGGVRA